ncbi:dTDP-4-amino-4,6-dideoxygalactose transaminase [Desulfotomaculum arcticum]|uniref:dTDP-4-amino-4,6-dideoxygalactose transaminase n=1 Tax=Desulfotruncus arcticus DSM 17038 TaxID=1121424 RepID=A0A1I2XXK9_9FIRM|nr:DegT/DnrJ/EryC1/StrS family aminotransferase [Desulfotruncus arcticus]SFH17819.1 dTDP-4-amino-4,6-dideoxygalactose transaminase [Desulfotomaculum arcticum] [Desulfotruncus arcticus DSM 17038]
MKNKPAVAGGRPVREKVLPMAKSVLNDNDINAVTEVLRGGKLGSGEAVSLFEQAMTAYTGARYAVAVSSGAAGLHIALMSAAVGHMEEVITSPLTHPSTSNCILYQGGIHTFADIDPATFNIDPEMVAMKISDRTKALIPVHYAGNPCQLDALQELARAKDLVIIEDAAHALGGEYEGQKIGSISDLTVFSFSSPQNCYTGEGGMVTTDSEELYQWLTMFRENGMIYDSQRQVKPEGPWTVEMQDRGYNYRMTGMQAALGVSQLSRADGFIGRRANIAGRYNRAFSGHPAIFLPEQNSRGRSTWHYYVMALRTEYLKVSRREIFDALQTENIEVGVHYLPVFLHPYYLWIGHPDICTLDTSLCPKAEDLYHKLLTLPLYPAMTDNDAEDVIEAVLKVLNYFLRA